MAIKDPQYYLDMADRFLAMANGDPLSMIEKKQLPPAWVTSAVAAAEANIAMANAVYETS